MTVRLESEESRAFVLDVEGTTTPIAFVYQVLFPYARARAGAWLASGAKAGALRPAIDRLLAEQQDDRARGLQPPAAIHAYVDWLMDQDRKSPGLKTLQGLIWQDGFRSGALQGEVYADVPPAFERWRQRGAGLYIYSSGSVLAQQLLFGSTGAGDLTGFLDGYFDTAAGPKTAPDSYRGIARSAGLPASGMLFVSDVGAELDAARAAGMRTALCVRDEMPAPGAGAHPVIRSFAEIP